jgi:hypothetical protein
MKSHVRSVQHLLNEAFIYVFGPSLRYAPDPWPVLEPGNTLSINEAAQLDIETLLNRPFVE